MLLEARAVRAGYGAGEVLHGVDLTVEEGSVRAVLGANGAGKSTLLKVLAGLLEQLSGTVLFDGLALDGHPAAERARCGIYLLPEGRAVFPSLTVGENLRLSTARPERESRALVSSALETFPRLRERRGQVAGTLSGGEQRMLALARAFVAAPRLLILDEPSLGLAPLVIEEVFQAVDAFRARGTAIILVEQYVDRALALASDVTVLAHGQVTYDGAAQELDAEALARHYLGEQGSVPVSAR